MQYGTLTIALTFTNKLAKKCLKDTRLLQTGPHLLLIDSFGMGMACKVIHCLGE